MTSDQKSINPQLPIGYDAVAEDEVAIEASHQELKVKDHNEDSLPFNGLGGRRFELLAYLVTLNEQERDLVLLAQGTADKGRDVMVYRNGSLDKVIQCKNLRVAFTKPDLLKELVKLGLHHALQPFIPETGIDYEVWAPGGLTGPAAELLNLWPKQWLAEEVQTAFDSLVAEYVLLSQCTWSDSAGFLVDELPTLLRPRGREGIELSSKVRALPRVYERFFEARVTMDREDVQEFLRSEFKAGGLRQVAEDDIARILDALQEFPTDERFNLGSYVLGLTGEHYAMMTKEEMLRFNTNCMKAGLGNVSVLLSALSRHIQARTADASRNMRSDSSAFKYVLNQVIMTRFLSRISELSFPKALGKTGPTAEDDGLSLEKLIEKRALAVWDEFETVEQRYQAGKDKRGSNAWLAASVARFARIGARSKEAFETTLLNDFSVNLATIRALECELMALVPEQIIVISDTRSFFDDKKALAEMAKSVKIVERAQAKRRAGSGEGPPEDSDERTAGRGAPRLDSVTWSKVPYRDGAYFRGYKAAIVFRGQNFAEGLEVSHRQGDQAHLRWGNVNLILPNYAELSVNDDELESPLSWRGTSFSVRNSPAEQSAWVRFTHNFDWKSLSEELDRCEKLGVELLESGQSGEAVEPLRRAMVFAERIPQQAERAAELRRRHDSALDNAALEQMRFREGDRVRLVAGEMAGETGTVARLMLRRSTPYLIQIDGTEGQTLAAEEQLADLGNEAGQP